MGLAIISFDAVSSGDIEYLGTLENFSQLMQRGTLVTGVESVFLTNTYPVHSSVITGMLPHRHGVHENTFPDDKATQLPWRCYRDSIKTTTLYDEAKNAGIETCAILWPVSGKANISKNLPEVIADEGKSQILTSLRAGSRGFSLMCALKYGKYLDGVSQPGLDDFALRCAVYAHRRHRFDLLLLHLTDVDHYKHRFGPDSDEARAAMNRLDERLGMLMRAYSGWDFIVFGDHGCKSVAVNVDLNRFWSDPTSFWHPAGGCAFLKARGTRAPQDVEALLSNPDCHIKRLLSREEMATSGLDTEFVLGIEAEDGCCFSSSSYKGNHGYSLNGEDYGVFYLATGQSIHKNKRTTGGSVMDIAPLAARLLGLPLWDMDGKLNTEVWKG